MFAEKSLPEKKPQFVVNCDRFVFVFPYSKLVVCVFYISPCARGVRATRLDLIINDIMRERERETDRKRDRERERVGIKQF
jgi:hypothetical protein